MCQRRASGICVSSQARGRYAKDPETGKKIRQPGRVRHDEMQAWLRDKAS
jgi:tRNA-splicing ligase RtcB